MSQGELHKTHFFFKCLLVITLFLLIQLGNGKLSRASNESNLIAADNQHITLTSAKVRKIDNAVSRAKGWGTLLITASGSKKITYRTYGYADYQHKVRNTVTELYPLSSLQKAYTAFMIERLVSAGKIRLDENISAFYPQIKYAHQITIRELLNHTSGIQMAEPEPREVLHGDQAALNWTITHLTSTGIHKWNYSNANYTLLAGVITQITKRPFSTDLNSEIIQPLNLRETYIWDQLPTRSLVPDSYTATKTPLAPFMGTRPLLSSELGCGNLYSSITNYYTFINALQSQKLLNHAQFVQLMGTHAGYSGGIYYSSFFHHAEGADMNYHTFYYGTSQNKLTIIFFTNRCASMTTGNELIKTIHDIVLS
ncbi:MAG: serine hydrolase domain-containing protein [Liquorilactobacillus satsumensis]